MKTIRCVFCSDLHTRDVEMPEGDLLICAGDFTFRGTLKERVWLGNWLKQQKQKFKKIIFILGNHDIDGAFWGPLIAQDTGSIYLENTGCEVLGLNIWGSPITPTFGNWEFMKERGNEIRRVWNEIPESLDILITHGPPYGILDIEPYRNTHCGCWDLLDVVRKVKPRYHVFGHIHDGYGIEIQSNNRSTITFINASICTEEYQPDNPPIVLDIPVIKN